MPSNNVTLSSSIRQNLLSLQNTTRLLDLTSNRLSTGLRVNSSLDSPAAFFAARSLTNRANDLSSRKDGIGQAVSLLQSTDKSLTALTSLVEQAKAKATEADEAATDLVISTKKAAETGAVTTISTAFSAGTTATTVTLSRIETGIVAGEDIDIQVNGGTTITVTLTVASTVATLIASLTAIEGLSAVFNSVTDQIDITANGGADVIITEGNASALTRMGGFKVDGVLLVSGATQIFKTQNKDTDLLEDVFGLLDTEQIITTVTSNVAGATTFISEDASPLPSTIADLVTSIAAADDSLTVSYNTTTSKIDIKAAEGVAVDFSGTGFARLTLNDGAADLVSAQDVTFTKTGTAASVGALTTDFRTLLDQINGLISDASYKGTNLLKASATLDVKFNATGDSKLSILGKALENDGAGILTGLKFTQKSADYDFQTQGDIASALTDVDAAITELRTIAGTFSTSLGVMQTREDFTNQLVNALENGAAKLVNANLEEESAKLLALQTRQAIGVQSLAIANTSQQSILALFR